MAGISYPVSLIGGIDLVAGYGFSGSGLYSVNGASIQWDPYENGSRLEQWMTWIDVSPSDGSILITVSALDGVAPVNAMRVTLASAAAVPEPSTYGLLIGLAAFASVVRKKKRGACG